MESPGLPRRRTFIVPPRWKIPTSGPRAAMALLPRAVGRGKRDCQSRVVYSASIAQLLAPLADLGHADILVGNPRHDPTRADMTRWLRSTSLFCAASTSAAAGKPRWP